MNKQIYASAHSFTHLRSTASSPLMGSYLREEGGRHLYWQASKIPLKTLSLSNSRKMCRSLEYRCCNEVVKELQTGVPYLLRHCLLATCVDKRETFLRLRLSYILARVSVVLFRTEFV